MNDLGFQPGPVTRPVGLETEFGVLRPGDPYANPVVLSNQVVEAYCAGADAPSVRWDYEGEDPLADLRGGRLRRSAAHPSQLTDDPALPAPSADASPVMGAVDPPPAPWGSQARPSAVEEALPRAAAAVLVNGARLYVDHAHPEYSSPEVLTPHDALVWDRAGEVVARRAMAVLDDAVGQGETVLYKNNVDGKGAAYGSHENYLVRRDLPFEELAAVLTPFLVTRAVLVGAGRVGIGQHSQRPGFQVSQRADYVESEIGLQTTFNRPIINTRDEPHADGARWRRLHVINGDANRFDVPIYLKVATTDLLLWFLEQAHSTGAFKDALAELSRLAITGDPVEEHWAVSHDPTLTYELATRAGTMSALVIQRAYLEVISPAVTRAGDPSRSTPWTCGARASSPWSSGAAMVPVQRPTWWSGSPSTSSARDCAAGREPAGTMPVWPPSTSSGPTCVRDAQWSKSSTRQVGSTAWSPRPRSSGPPTRLLRARALPSVEPPSTVTHRSWARPGPAWFLTSPAAPNCCVCACPTTSPSVRMRRRPSWRRLVVGQHLRETDSHSADQRCADRDDE